MSDDDRVTPVEALEALFRRLAEEAGESDLFEDARDAVAGGLAEIGEALQDLSSAAARAGEDASATLTGLAAAVAGAGSLSDVVDRVKRQLSDD